MIDDTWAIISVSQSYSPISLSVLNKQLSSQPPRCGLPDEVNEKFPRVPAGVPAPLVDWGRFVADEGADDAECIDGEVSRHGCVTQSLLVHRDYFFTRLEVWSSTPQVHRRNANIDMPLYCCMDLRRS